MRAEELREIAVKAEEQKKLEAPSPNEILENWRKEYAPGITKFQLNSIYIRLKDTVKKDPKRHCVRYDMLNNYVDIIHVARLIRAQLESDGYTVQTIPALPEVRFTDDLLLYDGGISFYIYW